MPAGPSFGTGRGIHSKTGLVTFHGPVGLGPWNSFTVEHFTRILFEGQAAEFSNPKLLGDNLTQVQDRIQTIVPGVARGRMLGGNLTVLSAIVGSSYLPHWNDAILFLEDIQEDIYRVDRMLTQLALAGILDEISGFVFGNCTDCGPGRELRFFDDRTGSGRPCGRTKPALLARGDDRSYWPEIYHPSGDTG